VSGVWIYAAVAALHVPGIALLALLLRDLGRCDPPDSPEASGGSGGGPQRGWRWQRRPGRDTGPQRARARRV
jgi:hypothetical protein